MSSHRSSKDKNEYREYTIQGNFYVRNISGLNLGLVVAQFIIKNINSHGDYTDDSEELVPNTKREGGVPCYESI